MKKMAIVLTLGMCSIILPPAFPLHPFVSQAYADDSGRVVANKAQDRIAPSAIPTAVAQQNQGVAQGVVDNRNAVASMTGADANDEATQAPMADGTEEPNTPTPPTALEVARLASQSYINEFVNKNWRQTGFRGVGTRTGARIVIANRLDPMIQMAVVTGIPITYTNDPISHNLEITLTIPNVVVINVVIAVDPHIEPNPTENQVHMTHHEDYDPNLAENIINALRAIIMVALT